MRYGRSRTVLLGTTVLAILCSAAEATVIVLQPSSQDAFIQQDKPNRIAGAGPSHTRIRLKGSPPFTQTRRGLVQFDLSAVPTGSTINSANLELFEGNNPGEDVTHGVHAIDVPWLQSAIKWNTQPAHQATPTDTALIVADTSRDFKSFDVTTDVQDFVNQCADNHGWMVKDQDETGNNEDVNYVSREEGQVSEQLNRPRLTIDFAPPSCIVDQDCPTTNPCTTNSRCVGGFCEVDPVDCDDANPCTDDICDCTQGCLNVPICNDGFSCTIDSCDPVTLACNTNKMDAFCTSACSDGTCEADPNRNDLDILTGCLITSTSPAGTPCSDGDPCTGGEECDGAGTCAGAEPIICDHYIAYKAKGSKLLALPDLNKFPKDWNVSLDDVKLANVPADLFPDDPENYLVKKERSIVNPAMKNDEPGPFLPDLHYVRYQIKNAKEGIGPEDPPASGSFPKAVKAPRRLWHVSNQFGDLFLQTKKAATLWVPAGKAEAPGIPTDPGDATHFVCYQAKAAKIPSTQAPDTNGNGKGKFRKDLQHYFSDQFNDCAVLKDEATVPFETTPVEAKCLYDLKKVREICSPVDKTAVQPTRFTTATIDDSIATVRGQSLLCYQAKLTKKLVSTDAATLGGLLVGDKIKQRKHVQRRLKNGTQVNVFPGNQFPRPVSVDTKKTELVCIPTEVLSVSDL